MLFGSLLNVGPYDMWLAIGSAAVILAVLAALFKEIVFYAFDETVSRVFGVRTTAIHYVLLALLAVAIVLTVRLAGIVLVTALLVIPGATANLLSRRLGRVIGIAWLVGIVGVAGGLALSLELGNLSTGPCIVAVLCAIHSCVRSFVETKQNGRQASSDGLPQSGHAAVPSQGQALCGCLLLHHLVVKVCLGTEFRGGIVEPLLLPLILCSSVIEPSPPASWPLIIARAILPAGRTPIGLIWIGGGLAIRSSISFCRRSRRRFLSGSRPSVRRPTS